MESWLSWLREAAQPKAQPTRNPAARVAPISDSVIGGMLASKSAITQANRIYILNDSLFVFSCHFKLILIGCNGLPGDRLLFRFIAGKRSMKF